MTDKVQDHGENVFFVYLVAEKKKKTFKVRVRLDYAALESRGKYKVVLRDGDQGVRLRFDTSAERDDVFIRLLARFLLRNAQTYD